MQDSGDVWCSTEDGTPLKWHRPSGVLFDLHGTPEELPWRLVVHFTKFPQAQVSAGSRPPRNSARPPALAKLPTCAARLTPALTRAYLLRQLLSPCGKRDVQWHFMNTVKEAIFLRYGSTQPLTSLARISATQAASPSSRAPPPHHPQPAYLYSEHTVRIQTDRRWSSSSQPVRSAQKSEQLLCLLCRWFRWALCGVV